MSAPANGRLHARAVLAALILGVAPPAAAQEAILDIAGRPAAFRTADSAGEGAAVEPGVPRYRAGGIGHPGGGGAGLPAGAYLDLGAGAAGGSPRASLVNLFKDGTLEYLPLREWDLGDIETGDLDGDGRGDIAFALSRGRCDSIPGTRPRVWIQNSSGRFVDETESRIPPLSTSTFDLDLFDADGDSDLDILVCGYSCYPARSPATLLINDGTGHFADETDSRLIGVPEFTILYFAAQARLDSGDSPDIAAILLDVRDPGDITAYPFLFLNTGDGHFWPDLFGRLLSYGSYGFFGVEAAELTGDTLDDLLFLNVGNPSSGRDGGIALFRNAGNGFLADETPARVGADTARSTRDVAIADVDGDGDPDILDVGFFSVPNDPQVRLLVNDGAGFYAPAAAGALPALTGWFNDAEFAPFFQGGLPDLFVAKVRVGDVAADLLLLNDGGGGFRDSSDLLPTVQDFSVAAATFDYDRDGDFDIAIGSSAPFVNLGGQNRLYINQRLSPPVSAEEPGGLPRSAELLGNYPNPFNPSTSIRFRLATAADVTISAAGLLGAEVMRVELPHRPPGVHEVSWNAAHLPAGIYWYTLRVSGRRVATKAALLIR